MGEFVGVPVQEALQNRRQYTTLFRSMGAVITQSPELTAVGFPGGSLTTIEKSSFRGSDPGEISSAPRTVLRITKDAAANGTPRRKVELAMGGEIVDLTDARVAPLQEGVQFTLFSVNGNPVPHPVRSIQLTSMPNQEFPKIKIIDRREHRR